MTYTTPRDWVAGEKVTAVMMNANVRDNVKALASKVTTYSAATFTVPASSTTALTGLTVAWDNDTIYDTSTGKYTVKQAGTYRMKFNVGTCRRSGAVIMTDLTFRIRINGATSVIQKLTAGNCQLGWYHTLAANDYVEFLIITSTNAVVSNDVDAVFDVSGGPVAICCQLELVGA